MNGTKIFLKSYLKYCWRAIYEMKTWKILVNISKLKFDYIKAKAKKEKPSAFLTGNLMEFRSEFQWNSSRNCLRIFKSSTFFTRNFDGIFQFLRKAIDIGILQEIQEFWNEKQMASTIFSLFCFSIRLLA